jgi:selenocysteine lyase/cysteine desulfurase
LLYVRRSILDQLEPVMLDLHAAQWTSRDEYTVRDDARRFENWETNYAAKIGLGVALDYALDWGMDAIWERIQEVAGNLRSSLGAIPGVTVRDIGLVQGGIVTFTIDGRDLAEVQAALAAQSINVTVSRTSSTRLDMEDRGLDAVIRASVHYYNSDDEVARFCAAIEALA